MRGAGGAPGVTRFVFGRNVFHVFHRVLHSDVFYLLGHRHCVAALSLPVFTEVPQKIFEN